LFSFTLFELKTEQLFWFVTGHGTLFSSFLKQMASVVEQLCKLYEDEVIIWLWLLTI